jgi:hypothetical protein
MLRVSSSANSADKIQSSVGIKSAEVNEKDERNNEMLSGKKGNSIFGETKRLSNYYCRKRFIKEKKSRSNKLFNKNKTTEAGR